MSVVGIIAEFNPFHNGHAYLIEEARRITGADLCVIVMSGDFVQRGTPAFCDKFERTRMALQNGADAVFELPAAYSCAQAELFAESGIKLLAALGCVDYIAFGSECGDISRLMKCAELLIGEPEEYRELLSCGLKQGLSFPAAREAAIRQLPEYSELADLLSSPNNILAVEYCKAILRCRRQNSSNIPVPVTILRKGEDYSSVVLSESSFSSASAIRHMIENNNAEAISGAVPSSVYSQLLEGRNQLLPITEDLFSDMLHIRLATMTDDEMKHISEMTPDIFNSIKKCYAKSPCATFTETAQALKSKNVTYSTICRILTHIILGIPNGFIDLLKNSSVIPYARLLGFKKSCSALLRTISDNESCILITKLADGVRQVKKDDDNSYASKLLDLDIRAGACFDMAVRTAYGHIVKTEFERDPIIL